MINFEQIIEYIQKDFSYENQANVTYKKLDDGIRIEIKTNEDYDISSIINSSTLLKSYINTIEILYHIKAEILFGEKSNRGIKIEILFTGGYHGTGEISQIIEGL